LGLIVEEGRLVVYDSSRWRLLQQKRALALALLRHLERHGIAGFLYGSVARGDIAERSDVDVFVPDYNHALLEQVGREFAEPHRVAIVQATPSHAPKAYIYFDAEELYCLSFPLAPLSPREEEFYRFGGLLSLRGLEAGDRVPGVNKRLMLVYPVEEGHRELEVVGREGPVARLLGISQETVKERVRVLSRRREKGRTGVYMAYTLRPGETLAAALFSLASLKAPLRRLLESRGVL